MTWSGDCTRQAVTFLCMVRDQVEDDPQFDVETTFWRGFSGFSWGPDVEDLPSGAMNFGGTFGRHQRNTCELLGL